MRPTPIFRWTSRVPTLLPAFFGTLLLVLSSACTDGDIREGCKKYCACHVAKTSSQTCRKGCENTLTALKKRDRPHAKQVAECLAAKGKRSCDELSLCARGVL